MKLRHFSRRGRRAAAYRHPRGVRTIIMHTPGSPLPTRVRKGDRVLLNCTPVSCEMVKKKNPSSGTATYEVSFLMDRMGIKDELAFNPERSYEMVFEEHPTLRSLHPLYVNVTSPKRPALPPLQDSVRGFLTRWIAHVTPATP